MDSHIEDNIGIVFFLRFVSRIVNGGRKLILLECRRKEYTMKREGKEILGPRGAAYDVQRPGVWSFVQSGIELQFGVSRVSLLYLSRT